MEFTIEGVTLAGLGDQIPTDPHPLTGHQEYGDISFLETYSKVQYKNFIFIKRMRSRDIEKKILKIFWKKKLLKDFKNRIKIYSKLEILDINSRK